MEKCFLEHVGIVAHLRGVGSVLQEKLECSLQTCFAQKAAAKIVASILPNPSHLAR